MTMNGGCLVLSDFDISSLDDSPMFDPLVSPLNSSESSGSPSQPGRCWVARFAHRDALYNICLPLRTYMYVLYLCRIIFASTCMYKSTFGFITNRLICVGICI